jgi:benzoate membrane transport protein
MGLFAATLVSLLMSFPQIFIVALAGIALFATISHIAVAFSNVEEREAALLTFLCSASGIQFWGIGSAFWGLILGIFILILFKFKLKNKP